MTRHHDAKHARTVALLRRTVGAHRRPLGAAMVAAATVIGMVVAGPLAGATPAYKYYSALAGPSPIYVGKATPVTVTLTNSSSSNQSFGSAELTLGGIPASDVGTATTVPAGWSATSVGTNPDVILLKSLALPAIAPGGTLTVTFSITPPSASPITIGTVVKQSNDFSGSGNNFSRSGSNPTIQVIPVTLSFQQQPSAVQQSDLKSSSFSYICPPVSVLVKAGTQAVSGIKVTLTDGATGDPGLYYGTTKVTSSGVSATSDANGLATFGTIDANNNCPSGLAATNLGSGYTLSANSTAASGSVTSNPFSVVQSLQTCTQASCNSPTLNSPTTGTSGTIDALSFGTPNYKLLGSFGQGGLLCDSQVTTTAGDPLVTQATTGASGTITMTFPKSVVNNLANNGTPLMQVCAGASEPFSGSNTTALTGTPYPYQGLLPNCPSGYQTASGFELCVVSRSKNAANETIQIYASDLSDPSFW